MFALKDTAFRTWSVRKLFLAWRWQLLYYSQSIYKRIFPEQSQMKEKTGRRPTIRDTELQPGSLLWEFLQAIEIENFVIDFFLNLIHVY